MADVHIREISKVTGDRGKVSLIFHIPIDNQVLGVIPTPKSTIESEIGVGERGGLAAGIIVELPCDIVVAKGQSIVEIKAKIKAAWRSARAAYNTEYKFKYKFYGDTIADASA